MNKVRLLIGAAAAALVLAACSKDDNPVFPDNDPTVNVDTPQDEVTDQPAAARQN